MATATKIIYNHTSIEENDKHKSEVTLKVNTTKSMYLVHRALVQQLEKRRQGTANSKTRHEVRGGGRKPWKQKGTGKARVGSIRSPLWRGGGATFGPKYKNYSNRLNDKEKKLAIGTLLHNKVSQTLIISDNKLSFNKPNTKTLLSIIKQCKININQKILIIVPKKEYSLYLSIRNIQNIEIIQANQINIVSLLKANQLLITNKSLNVIEEVYNG